jgi:hypothetical protein
MPQRPFVQVGTLLARRGQATPQLFGSVLTFVLQRVSRPQFLYPEAQGGVNIF